MNNVSILASSIVTVFVGLGTLIVGLVIGFFTTKFFVSKKISNSKTTAAKIIEEAYAEAKTVRKEAVIEAKEEIHTLRNEFEKETKSRRVELQRSEDRITQKEQFIDKKDLFLEKKQEEIEKTKQELTGKERQLEKHLSESKQLKEQALEKLEKVAGLTKEEAKQSLVESMVDDAKKDSVQIIAKMQQEAEEQGEKLAKEIVATAIQKCATDMTAEMTTSTVTIPNEEMKGRIIGREGRNIRAIEQATGVDLIIDDTPDAITVSCFEPVRREVAKLSLEKLIKDGRIHPARIEGVVDKIRADVESVIKQAGEEAVTLSEVFGLHPEIVKVLGRLKYRTSYGQNALRHSLEVAHLAGLLAEELGADSTIAKKAGLLHDIGKAVDHEVQGTHPEIGRDIAKKFGLPQNIIDPIETHHDDKPRGLLSVIVKVADAISAARPGARKDTYERYLQRLKELEDISLSFEGVEKTYAIQAGREVRVFVTPNEIDDLNAHKLAQNIAKKIETELKYPGEIKVNVIREMRVEEYAR